MSRFVIGLTGGIAAGKSEVSRRFEALGITVADADLAARAVVAPGSADFVATSLLLAVMVGALLSYSMVSRSTLRVSEPRVAGQVPLRAINPEILNPAAKSNFLMVQVGAA